MMHLGRLIPLPFVLALAVAAAPVPGQERVDDLRKSLDAGVEDLGPLSASLRDMRVDLRQPVGFENVYRVGEQDDLLMRISGGLHAVFPRSVYADTSFGPLPLTPPGTIYFIGKPDPLLLGRAGLGEQVFPPAPDDRFGVRVNARIDEAPLDEEAADESGLRTAPPPEDIVYAVRQRTMPPVVDHDRAYPATLGSAGRIVSDPEYRSQRLRALLKRAAEAELASGE